MAKILAVDDEPSVLRALERELRGQPFDLVTEIDPLAALERLKTEHFDVIISDFRMPGVDGLRLLTEARKRQPQSVRMMLSGHADVQDLLLSIIEAGIYRFIPKPWSMPELSAAISEALAQRRVLLENDRARAIAREAECQAPRRALLDDARDEWSSRDPDATAVSHAPVRWGNR